MGVTRRAIARRVAKVASALGAWAAFGPARAQVGLPAPLALWDATTFDFKDQGRVMPGVAIRVPRGAAPGSDLYVACSICPHQGCVVGYERSFEVVGDIVGKDLPNPVLFCRCHLSVYDPAAQGAVLFGPAPRPLWRFDAREEDGRLVIVGLEAGAGDLAEHP